LLRQLFAENQNVVYTFGMSSRRFRRRDDSVAPAIGLIADARSDQAASEYFTLKLARKPLKSLISDERIQENPRECNHTRNRKPRVNLQSPRKSNFPTQPIGCPAGSVFNVINKLLYR
jgi:hypothetical protein